MRNLVLFLTFALGAALHALAQSTIRPGGQIQGGPGRVTSPLPPTPTPGVSTVRPGIPDARLGAGGIRPYTGNIVYPGTPNGRSVGNILSPGIPTTAAQSIPSIVQPARQPPRPTAYGMGRERRHGSVRRYAGDYPVYGFYAYPLVPNVIAVTGSTMTRAGAGYVVTVGEEPAGEVEEEARAVEEATEPPAASEPDYWLIALRGGLIYAVSDYTIESRALRFVTLQGDEYVVPLAELDRDFTVKLNQDRNVSIELD